MPNKFYAQPGMKRGLGTGGSKAEPSHGSQPSSSMPERTADWPGPPGKTQPKSRAGGTATTGRKSAPFYVKKSGL